jgi:GntR family transcriptional regulator/MocR family aminotransferase
MQLIKQMITIDPASKTSVYLQITNAFIQHIHQGRFRKGLKLPGSRQLADLLKINRMTAVAAYQELNSQGWIEMVPRKGTFVKVTPPLLAPKKIGDKAAVFALPETPLFWYKAKNILPPRAADGMPHGKLILYDGGFPDVRLAPIEQLIKTIRSLSKIPANKKYLMYGNPQGTLYLRKTLAAFLCDTRGLSITAENVLITKGAQMGIFIATSLLLNQREEVIVGTPGYAGANSTFEQLGATINHVPVHSDGIDVGAIEKICQRKQIRMVYVIPHHHHPTTATLTPAKRIRLLQLATKYKFAVMEDDNDYDFHYTGNPMMPMASLDRSGNVIYIGTLTKSLAPAIRLGFVVAPTAFVRAATHLRKSIDTQGDSLIENAVAEMYNDGTIARHLKKSVKLYKERRDYFCDLLKTSLGNEVAFKIPDGGMMVWATFLKHELPRVSSEAFRKGLIMNDGADYNTKKMKYNSVGLGFASLNFKEQDKAIEILRQVLKSL